MSKRVSGYVNKLDARFQLIDVYLEEVLNGSNEIISLKIGVYNSHSVANYVSSVKVESFSVGDHDWTDYTTGTSITNNAVDTATVAALQMEHPLTIGVDGTSHDVIFYGDTSGKKMLWDQSADTLVVDGALDVNGNADISGNITTATWAGAIIDEAKLENQSGTNTGDTSITDSTSTTSSTTRASATAAKAAYDRGSTGITNAASAQTTANAALPKVGGAMTGAITTNSTFDGVDVAAAGTLATNALPKGGGTMSGAIAMGTSKITGMGDPTANQDAATKAYVDGAVIANTDTNVDVSTLETRLGQINSSITIGNGASVATTAAGALTATGHLTAPTSKIGWRNLDWAGSSADIAAAQGDVIYHQSSIATTEGAIYQMQNNGNVALADADAVNTSTTLLMVALSNNANKGLLLRGMVALSATPNANPGAPIYLSTTAGQAQNAAPSQTGDVVRILGYQLTNTEESNAVYFNPDNTWVELT